MRNKKQIVVLDGAKVHIGGCVELKIEEGLDGIYNIGLFEHCLDKNSFRFGIPSNGGMHYIFWDDVVEACQKATGKASNSA